MNVFGIKTTWKLVWGYFCSDAVVRRVRSYHLDPNKCGTEHEHFQYTPASARTPPTRVRRPRPQPSTSGTRRQPYPVPLPSRSRRGRGTHTRPPPPPTLRSREKTGERGVRGTHVMHGRSRMTIRTQSRDGARKVFTSYRADTACTKRQAPVRCWGRSHEG